MDETLFKPYQFFVKLASAIGLSKRSEKSLRNVILSNLCWMCSVGLNYLGVICNIIKINSISYLVDWMIMFLHLSLYFIKFANLAWQSYPLTEMHAELKELCDFTFDERFKNRHHIKKETKMMMKIVKQYLANSSVILLVTLISIICFKKLTFNIFSVEHEKNAIAFWIVSLQLVVASFYGNLAITVFNMTPLMLLSYAVGIINELSERLQFICLSDEFDYDEIVKCVQIHQKIKAFVLKIQKHFGMVWLFQILLSNVVICFAAFATTSANNSMESIKGLNLAALIFLEILLPCVMGDKLVSSSVQLMDAIGHSYWPDKKMNPKTKKVMLIFMENLKHPVKISFFNVIHVNLLTFRGIIDSAYSLYAVLAHFATIVKLKLH